ncbi:GNAT family N-acetyltransferase [Brevibacillus migulae]|uniref:GNAT family N-acetyltransferase n=1 Tax=Brevibacillus migulae TaxID=1644114 RepID=UPI001F36781B|nr:GNAT family N-acetyltransferase [Brevibacillus migulae]
MVIVIKRLSTCTFSEAAEIWNKGFEGYFVDATTTDERFAARLGMEGLSPSLSVVAYVDDEPVGMVLTGIRNIQGKKVAWNGGTCIATAYRGQGLGKILMKAVLQVYEEEGVEWGTLEAFRENEKAIALYKAMGYDIVDRLLFLQRTEAFDRTNPFSQAEGAQYRYASGVPADVQGLSFYQAMAPWQTQWAGLRDGQSVLVKDQAGEAIGYALYRRAFDPAGAVSAITLFQCAAAPEREDADEIIRFALNHVFEPEREVAKRGTFNFPAGQERVVRILEEAGFSPSIEQVYMMKKM